MFDDNHDDLNSSVAEWVFLRDKLRSVLPLVDGIQVVRRFYNETCLDHIERGIRFRVNAKSISQLIECWHHYLHRRILWIRSSIAPRQIALWYTRLVGIIFLRANTNLKVVDITPNRIYCLIKTLYQKASSSIHGNLPFCNKRDITQNRYIVNIIKE